MLSVAFGVAVDVVAFIVAAAVDDAGVVVATASPVIELLKPLRGFL